MQELLLNTDRGLYCPPGDFFVDPWQPVERAIITHAHSDHAVPGCASYLTHKDGAGILRLRIGESSNIRGVLYADPVEINSVRISLHPAGHVLGSAQVRIE